MDDAPNALPMTIGLAASVDMELVSRYRALIGQMTADAGWHVLKGPAVNLHHTITADRNLEYFSENPHLSGAIGVEVTKSIQNHDISAMGKRYAVNGQKYERFHTNIELDERNVSAFRI